MTKPRRTLAIAACAIAATASTAAARRPRHTAPPWSHVQFRIEDTASHRIAQQIDVDRAGTVVLRRGVAALAPEVAKLPPALITSLDLWLAAGRSPAPRGTFTQRFAVTVDGKTIGYPANRIPAADEKVFEDASALINSPLTPLACAPWDGTGPFTLTLRSQDFGVAVGPIDDVAIKSDGSVTRTRSNGDGSGAKVEKTTKLTADEAKAVRAAIVAADLGHFTAHWGGGGEGSNLRLVHLDSKAGECGRSFTNDYDAGLAPLFATLAPAMKRL